MKLLLTFTRSMLIAALVGFIAPIVLLGMAWLGIQLWTYLPGVGDFGLIGNSYLTGFLTVFGNGSPLNGVLTIAIVCSLVGILFDIYVLYNAQTQKDHSTWQYPDITNH